MPKTRTGEKTTPETSDKSENLDITNMAAENEPTLKAIFDIVKSTNNTVTSMEIRLKRLEEEGNPEIKKISTQISEQTTNITVYTDQIASLEATVTTQKQEIIELSSKVSELEKLRRVHNLIVEGIPETTNEDVRYKIDQLFEDLDLDFGTDCCDFIYKMGQGIVDGVSFSHADIGRLPHEISLENAKVIEVEDGHAFQSEHAFLSSLYEIEIEYKDRKHRSAEHTFHHSRADENGQPDLAEQIRNAKTSREAMIIGR